MPEFLDLPFHTIRFEELPSQRIVVLDQTRLPNNIHYVMLKTEQEVAQAISSLMVRGAPLIGVVAAYGVYLGMLRQRHATIDLKRQLDTVCDYLIATRPTAVNLSWAVNRMRAVAQLYTDIEECLPALLQEAKRIHTEDKRSCAEIGNNGLSLLREGSTIITHCNAGALATSGIGTALAPIYMAAVHRNLRCNVFVDETRPVNQGARLTLWELSQNPNVTPTLMTDSMSAYLMSTQVVDMVIVGADRITSSGDVANKIGTYLLALAAKYHQVPFYVAAPMSTFDLTLSRGSEIVIEHRNGKEVLPPSAWGEKTYPRVFNPAFDVTPAHLITGFITDRGIFDPNKVSDKGRSFSEQLRECNHMSG